MTRAFPTRRSSDLRALLVASRNEHQGAVELRHVLEEKRDVHRPRLRHQIVARPGAVVLMPLPDVAVEGRLGVDLVLMHVDGAVEYLHDGVDQARMPAEPPEGLVEGGGREGGSADARLFSEILLAPLREDESGRE